MTSLMATKMRRLRPLPPTRHAADGRVTATATAPGTAAEAVSGAVVEPTTLRAAAAATAVVTALAAVAHATASPAISSVAAHGALHAHHLVKLRRNVLSRLFQHLDKFPRALGVRICEECVGSALLITTAGSADSVHIVLRTLRIVVIDDEFDVINI